MTIIEAIKTVMLRAGKPLSISEAYNAILSDNLYIFNADKPLHVVQTQIRRHCLGIEYASASQTKHFQLCSDGKYFILDKPIIEVPKIEANLSLAAKEVTQTEIKFIYQKYLEEFRRSTLQRILELNPSDFERFCRNLLKAYNFHEVKVTTVARDGGIDGYGRFQMGFTYLNVAFQCKRWNKKVKIGRPEIDKFRGAIQGQYDLGIFFTTTEFSPEAKKNTSKQGAVPIILLNGGAIVDIMIQQKFGVEEEQLSLFSLVLDDAISDDFSV